MTFEWKAKKLGGKAPEVPAESSLLKAQRVLLAADSCGRSADSIKNDILDVTYIFHADTRMKNKIMPSRQERRYAN